MSSSPVYFNGDPSDFVVSATSDSAGTLAARGLVAFAATFGLTTIGAGGTTCYCYSI